MVGEVEWYVFVCLFVGGFVVGVLYFDGLIVFDKGVEVFVEFVDVFVYVEVELFVDECVCGGGVVVLVCVVYDVGIDLCIGGEVDVFLCFVFVVGYLLFVDCEGEILW